MLEQRGFPASALQSLYVHTDRLRTTIPALPTVAVKPGGGLKMREWKNRYGNAGGGKCRSGNCGTVTQEVENEGVQNAYLVLSKLNIMNNSH